MLDAGWQVPFLVTLDGRPIDGIKMHGVCGMLLGMQTTSLSKQFVIWSYEREVRAGSIEAVGNVLLKFFNEAGSYQGPVLGAGLGALIKVMGRSGGYG